MFLVYFLNDRFALLVHVHELKVDGVEFLLENGVASFDFLVDVLAVHFGVVVYLFELADAVVLVFLLGLVVVLAVVANDTQHTQGLMTVGAVEFCLVALVLTTLRQNHWRPALL